ncbi:cysteine/serine-rich nuclear protein 3-like [Lampris incognitus]|uniref:cysteine/serine-rich nuclear protein 3-like n=1 Tax=Lampris incognitus TaxID=2546036 RepID=UPI0024B5BC20|nr:cysteine/serine-rich nuclear protein 3-like [Lampris incognitus]
MSGILKRKLEEGPSPYLSLLGSEDEEVSCSDSGNSSDSVNNPILGSSSLHQRPKRLRGRSVHFESVTVYYFRRRQGFTSVPTQGGSTLGMSPRHSWVKHFTLREFAMEQARSHRNMLRDHLKEEKLNAIKLKLTKNGTMSSVEADALTLDDISEDDLDLDNTEVDDYFFLQPLTTRRRRALLRSSGVRRIDVEEKHELRALRVSREECGCHCRGTCDPETCACSLAGIKCQVNGAVVDRMSFPCGCTKDGCSNTTGRLEFNPVRVRTHFLHTIMKLELERSREQQQQQQQQQPETETEQPLVTNGNCYHGDSSLVQQQPNLQFPLMNGVPQIPIMHLQNANNMETHIDEEEEEEDDDDEDDDEEEEEEEDEDDEAYEEDEDGSSLCSGLSDCSTHSLETIETEEEEEEEEEEDEEEDDREEEEPDGECSADRERPPLYSHTELVPLSSALGFCDTTHIKLSDPCRNTHPMERYQPEDSVNEIPIRINEEERNVPSLTTAEITESKATDGDCKQTDAQSSTHYLPNATESQGLTTYSHLATEGNNAPIGKTDEQTPLTDLQIQNNLNDNGSQIQAVPAEQAGEKIREQQKGLQGQRQLLENQDGPLDDSAQKPDQIRDPSCLEQNTI